VPDRVLGDLVPEATEILILPGGDMWTEGYPAERVDPVLHALVAADVPVAGICAATVALARAGLFRERRHTSNWRAFLEYYAPGYETPSAYVDTRAVSDRGVISASGLAPAEFAAEIFTVMRAFGDEEIAKFREMYRANS
jgi:putative intracellular protease/amidase